MLTIKDQLCEMIFEAVNSGVVDLIEEVKKEDIVLEHPSAEEHGDYSSNVAMVISSGQRTEDRGQSRRNPREIAEKIASSLKEKSKSEIWEKVEVAGPGFINFYIKKEVFLSEIQTILSNLEKYGIASQVSRKKIMVEFAHPNTHKQFHIGHLRNITLGESIVRLLEASGHEVIRANYQGDVGMHVAKAIYGVLRLPEEYKGAKNADTRGRVAFLGKAYVLGTSKFEEDEEAKKEIVAINKKIYLKDPEIMPLWQETRQWSLDYFQLIYDRVYSHFDRFYFESEVAKRGKELVMENVGKVFEESEGAIIFPGEKFGLHNRVFINSEGNPTYEGKDMGLGELQFKEYDPEAIIHNVGPEQTDYFNVIFEALAQLFPATRGREKHNAYGWVKLKEGKMSSRTGNVVLGEWLLDEVKKRLTEKYPDRVSDGEPIAIAAVKYSLLKVSSNQEIAFSIDESISLDGDSGPYLQYTYARARSVLRKAGENTEYRIPNTGISSGKDRNSEYSIQYSNLSSEELAILRFLYRFPEVVEQAAKQYAPNLICSYLFELAKRFNGFYNSVPILGPSLRSSSLGKLGTAGLNNVPILNTEYRIPNTGKGKRQKAEEDTTIQYSVFRIHLTEATSIVLKNGLNLLGIEVLERM